MTTSQKLLEMDENSRLAVLNAFNEDSETTDNLLLQQTETGLSDQGHSVSEVVQELKSMSEDELDQVIEDIKDSFILIRKPKGEPV